METMPARIQTGAGTMVQRTRSLRKFKPSIEKRRPRAPVAQPKFVGRTAKVLKTPPNLMAADVWRFQMHKTIGKQRLTKIGASPNACRCKVLGTATTFTIRFLIYGQARE